MSDQPQRLDPRVDRTREAVLTAVRELLNEDGWDAVTHVRVAERSATGRTTLYRHWPERIDLVREAYELELGVIREVRLTGDLRGDLIAATEAIRYELIERQGTRILTALISRSEFDNQVREIKKTLVDDALQVLRRVLSQAKEAKALTRDVSVENAVGELVGPMLMHRLVLDSHVGRDHVVQLVDAFLTAHPPAPGARRKAAGPRARKTPKT